MSIAILVHEYPGDQAWDHFVSVIASGSQDGSLKLADKAIARVLTASMGARASDWLDYHVPALEGRTPTDVLSSHPDGAKAIRTVLMRMPR